MKQLAVALAVLSVWSCNCGHPKLVDVEDPPMPPVKTCETDPSLCPTKPLCETDPSQCEPAKPGAISGRVCAGDGRTWLNGATVWVAPTSDGMRITTTSDA